MGYTSYAASFVAGCLVTACVLLLPAPGLLPRDKPAEGLGTRRLLAGGVRRNIADLFLQCWQPDSNQIGGWYMHPDHNRFQALGVKHDTDKVTDHNYQFVYGRAFELHAGAHRTHKLLEIGLGCDMWYGPGHSAKVWREYLPHAEIWFAEFDAACVEKYKPDLAALNTKVVTGDQADFPTLKRWVNETGGNFDVIVDDGGHSNMMMYNSFYTLFYDALKPGGLYVIEDIQASRTGKYVDGDMQHQFIDILLDWIDELVMNPTGPQSTSVKWPRPPLIKAIECSAHACHIIKCFKEDVWCNAPKVVNQIDPLAVQQAGSVAQALVPQAAVAPLG